MLRESVSLLVSGALAFGCASTPDRPPGNSSICTPIDGGPPCRGGVTSGGGRGTPPTLDSGVTSTSDATTTDAAPTTLPGSLSLFPSLPPTTAVNAGTTGWTVSALLPTDSDAGDPMLDATTSGTGAFELPGVPVAGVAPGTGVPSFWVTATFPTMGNIGSVFEVPATTTSLALQTFTDDTLRATLAAVGIVQDDQRAVLAVYVKESRSAGAAAVMNVLLQADGQSSMTLYDGASGTMEISLTGTGRQGFAILPNVPVPVSGDGFVAVTGARLTRPYQVRVRRHMMTWVLLTAI